MELKIKLIQTGDAYLEETNSWNDTYWGVCDGKGENILGHMLMKLRKDIVDLEKEYITRSKWGR